MKLGRFYVKDSTMKEYVDATEAISNRISNGHELHQLHERRTAIHRRLLVNAGIDPRLKSHWFEGSREDYDEFNRALYAWLLKRAII